MLRDYYLLAKPGIIRGNVLNTAGGFFLAATAAIDLKLLLATLAGTALVIASACVFNNYIDRGIDAKMKRTRDRPLPGGRLTARAALIYGAALGISGFTTLMAGTNLLTSAIGAVAFILYVVVYGYFKRRTPYGTLIGSVPGALPPVAGYAAVTGQLDMAAYLLFVILVAWQMAHFYAIGLYRHSDYQAAGLPIKPVVGAAGDTKRSIMAYIAIFAIACAGLTAYGYTGYVFLAVMEALALGWLWLGLKNYAKLQPLEWGRNMFVFSLTVILTLAVMLSLGGRLP